ncbi:DEAD/DEAH box helicase [Candidatus Poribacteria bacterium]|nr:DEAD/DEAH box helicase [Candidatus Poribacteria bacterium]
MTSLNLKPTHKPVKAYYESLQRFESIGVSHETAVRSAFQTLLEYCGRQFDWILVPEHSMTPLIRGVKNKRIVIDGALIDTFQLPHGYWEAKDIHDDLPTEVLHKFEKGYPRDNILFQTPHRAILWQNNQRTLDADLTDPTQLIHTLETFFSHRPQEYTEWEEAVAQFKDRVPALGNGLAELIEKERGANREFTAAFAAFHEKCRQSINPNLSEAAVEEMLIQHLLTERIFRTVFSNSEFTRRNVIAREIETVITALMSHAFSREDFLRSLDPFYVAIERTAATIDDFSQKQGFLNTVYEQFFQGFSVEVADTHGVVYTPQPIVDFMVRSVENILQSEFDRSLSDSGVHIIDPFVGTGNFIVRTMREIRPTALENKYQSELHCNEVMLLPYYIASMNIEHEFFEATGDYQPFEGICLVDTFELVEDRQLLLLTPDNTRRVEEQKATPMFVVIGNPPYNVGQVNENDNNKNRKYPTMDTQVKDTYAKDSTASNKNALADPYVKAIRWASDRIGKEGVVSFVTNNSFLDAVAFDGMRKHLADDFDAIYILDLGGNVKKNPKLSGTTHNVFGIQVGVSINFFIKKRDNANSQAEIFYTCVDEFWRKEDKYRYLDSKGYYRNIEWKLITPDRRYTWLTEGLHAEFETFIPIGTKEAKAARAEAVDVIFKDYSRGVATSRDAWAYNFNRNTLSENMREIIETYNAEVDRWKRRANRDANVDDFVISDDTKIKWSRDLKSDLQRGKIAEYDEGKARSSLYRPFTKSNLFLDRVMNEEVYVFPSIFPIPETEVENRVICVNITQEKSFTCLMVDCIPELVTTGGFGSPGQCFPFYTYDEDGKNRRENITDWALARFRAHYQDEAITKWDIFYHVYALLHHPVYRERYQVNLKRDLPRLLYTPDFWGFAKAGQRLGEIHIGYEEVEEYPLHFIENREAPIDWRVEKMKLSKDKTQLVYNDFLTLEGIPAKAFDYRLGNRSALEWVIDQYRLKTDKRSGIVNDPNRADDPRYIVKLIGKVIAVSLETVEIVENLPELAISSH